MHYWVDVNQNVNLKGIGPAMASEEKLTKNVFFGDVLNKDDFATFGNGVVKAYLKAKKESSK